MRNPFRRSQTPPDEQRGHRMTLDLIEQVTELRGRLRSIESEWDDIRVQIRKGYQRLEKANERAEAREAPCDDEVALALPDHPGNRFLEKFRKMSA